MWTAFRANDVAALDKLIHYPLAYIGNGRTTLLDAFPIQPAELMATKQWHDTQDLDPEVVFASADKAHVIVRATLASHYGTDHLSKLSPPSTR